MRSYAWGIKESVDPEVIRSMMGGIWAGSRSIHELKCEDPREAATVPNSNIIQLTNFRTTEVKHRRQVGVC